jgi:hypothetical protein
LSKGLAAGIIAGRAGMGQLDKQFDQLAPLPLSSAAAFKPQALR